MKIYNTKNISNFIGKICFIAEDLKIDLDFDKMSSNCWRVKLKLGPSKKYRRLGFMRKKDGSRSKVNAVCWHGYRDFMIELYKISPDFRIVSAQATYNNKEDFYSKYPATGQNNIGSMVDPLPYEEACYCNLNAVSVSAKEIAANDYNLSPSFWINKKRNELNQ